MQLQSKSTQQAMATAASEKKGVLCFFGFLIQMTWIPVVAWETLTKNIYQNNVFSAP